MLVERMQHFVLPTITPTTIPVIGLTQQVDLDASFRLFGVVVWNLGVSAGTGAEGQIAIRLYRPNGQQIQRQLTASNLLFGGNQYNQESLSPNKALVSPIHPGVLYPAGSVINIDVLGLNTGIASPTGVIVILVGTNIYQEGNVWNPQYPAKWKARPYLDNLTVQSVPVPGGFPLLSVPFTAQADSDFVWQAGVYTDENVSSTPPPPVLPGRMGAGDPVQTFMQLIDLGVIIRDPSYKGYSNTYVPAALLFPFLSSEAPGWLYPEIYIPRLGQIYFDFNYLYGGFTPAATPVTITLGLQGMKVYPQGS